MALWNHGSLLSLMREQASHPPRPPRGSGAAESTVSMPVGVAALSAFARFAGLSVRPSASVVQLGDWD